MKDLISALQNSTVVVKFVKTDGTIRQMACTLSKDSIIGLEKPSQLKMAIADIGEHDSYTVWDTEIRAWRKFKPDSIIEWETV
jgi:hypothetical protein